MLSRYSDVMKTPYSYDLFALDPFKVLDTFRTTSDRTNTRSRSYRVEETNEGLELSVDLPGVKSKDLVVKSTGRDVKIEGKLRGEDFSYVYRISKNYDPESVCASLEDGVLSLIFKKNSDAKTRTVHVQVK